MPSVHDAAQYILQQRGPMTTMKLQKLVYYSQVWTVVWNDDVLFPEPIEAWKNGPVVRALWEATKGQFRVGAVAGNPENVPAELHDTMTRVLDFYGPKDAQWLSDLTHLEAPWREAYALGQNTPISLERVSEYYSSLRPNGEG